MNKNNDKQRTTHEHYWESKKNIWTNQGKTKENQRKTHEKPKKEQWKTMENQRQLCQHSKLPFARDFWSCFFEVFIFNWERNKRHFWKKKETSLEVPWILYVHKTLQICSKLHFFLHMCFKRSGVIFLFAVFLVVLWRKKHWQERT